MADAKTDAVLNTAPFGNETLYDFQIDSCGDIQTEDTLDTAILVSLFTDQRAAPADVVKSVLRRGWVGDLETPGDLYGSLLWLFEQSRLTGQVVASLGDMAQKSLKWMTDGSIATEVSARAIVKNSGVDIKIDIKKPNSPAEAKLFALWDQTGKG